MFYLTSIDCALIVSESYTSAYSLQNLDTNRPFQRNERHFFPNNYSEIEQCVIVKLYSIHLPQMSSVPPSALRYTGGENWSQGMNHWTPVIPRKGRRLSLKTTGPVPLSLVLLKSHWNWTGDMNGELETPTVGRESLEDTPWWLSDLLKSAT